MSLQARCWLGLQHPFPRWLFYVAFILVLAVKLVLSLYTALSAGLLECPQSMAAGFPQIERSKRPRQKLQYLGLVVKRYHFCHILLDTQNISDWVWEETIHKGMNHSVWGSLGTISEMPPTVSLILPFLLYLFFLCVGFIVKQPLPSNDKDGHQHLKTHIFRDSSGKKVYLYPKFWWKSPAADSGQSCVWPFPAPIAVVYRCQAFIGQIEATPPAQDWSVESAALKTHGRIMEWFLKEQSRCHY